ncbi:hypothetical protein JB92DRAFT_2904718 [Gautieria morchelliformis]|nr:hypothetical protein JB92DRAFT_2904718 [Gautieria morchelliformis]
MDKFVTITKRSALAINKGDSSKRQFKYNPYPIPKAKERQVEAWRNKKRTEKILAPLREEKKIPATSSSKALTKHLLNTLKDETNPITHSTIGQRSAHVESCATGHQRGDYRRLSEHSKSRSEKLESQRQEKGRGGKAVLEGIRIYVGGYMAGTTDIEMKRIVTMAGGKVMLTSAGATHILTSQGLSGSKLHKHLHSSTVNKVHVVTPEWVFDSIAAGNRKKEWDYTVIKDSTVYNLGEFGVGSSHAGQD